MDRSVKLLLTLLALIGGLSVTPAQARACLHGHPSVAQVEAGGPVTVAVAAAVAAAKARGVTRSCRTSAEPARRQATGAVAIPTIRWGDRARE